MKTQSADTGPEAEKILISLLRKESFSKKLMKICSLSDMTMHLSKRAISRANTNLDETGIKLLFINYHYGSGLAERVKKYIENAHHGST